MHPVALAAGQDADLLLLVRAFKVERADIRAGVHPAFAEVDHVLAATDLLPDRVVSVQAVTRLVDIAKLHRLADAQSANIRLFLADDHTEQRRFTGTVRTDDADNAAWRQTEVQI